MNMKKIQFMLNTPADRGEYILLEETLLIKVDSYTYLGQLTTIKSNKDLSDSLLKG